MASNASELADALRSYAELPGGEAVVAAWLTQLMSVQVGDEEVWRPNEPRAILGVTDTHGYLLSDIGLFAFDLALIKYAYSQRRNELRFAVRDGEASVSVHLTAPFGALAIASQLLAMAEEAPHKMVAANSRAAGWLSGRRIPRVVPKRRSLREA